MSICIDDRNEHAALRSVYSYAMRVCISLHNGVQWRWRLHNIEGSSFRHHSSVHTCGSECSEVVSKLNNCCSRVILHRQATMHHNRIIHCLRAAFFPINQS
eukprot:GHVU01141051.1.p2 GENE.GHVU01141051.1~~GHVU01141051.1.p2  ORF type:complete len:101 (+),score=4.15 GHVU01141051.1:416-718(+)